MEGKTQNPLHNTPSALPADHTIHSPGESSHHNAHSGKCSLVSTTVWLCWPMRNTSEARSSSKESQKNCFSMVNMDMWPPWPRSTCHCEHSIEYPIQGCVLWCMDHYTSVLWLICAARPWEWPGYLAFAHLFLWKKWRSHLKAVFTLAQHVDMQRAIHFQRETEVPL